MIVVLSAAGALLGGSTTSAQGLLSVRSDPGDWVGSGLTWRMVSPSAVFNLASGCCYNVQINAADSSRGVSITFYPPKGRLIQPGIYSRTFDDPLAAQAELRVTVDNHGCSEPAGRCEVRRVERNASGAITGFWALFDQYCSGAAAGLHGEVRVNTDTSFYAQSPADTFLAPGQPLSFDVRCVDVRGLPMQLSASGLPPGATFTDHGDGTGRVDWPGGSPVPTDTTVMVSATSVDGRRALTYTTLHVHLVNFLRFVSAPGDPEGQGQTLSFSSPADGDLAGHRVSTWYSDYVLMSFQGSNHNWSLRLASPYRRPLTTGTYTGAVTTPLPAVLTTPGIGFYGDGRAVDGTGLFQIRRIRFDPAGDLSTLWATFTQVANGSTSPLTGEICWNGDTALYVDAPADLYPAIRQAVHLDVAAHDLRGRPLRLSAVGLPTGSTFADRGAGVGAFDWPAGSPRPDSLAVTFVAVSDLGDSATAVTVLHVFKPDLFEFVSDPGDPVGMGATFIRAPTNRPFALSFLPWGGTVGLLDGKERWTLGFTPAGIALTPGVYAVGTRDGTYDAGAWLSLSRSLGVNCGSIIGSFEIRRIAFDNNQVLRTLWATFNQQCVGASGGLHGEFRMNTDTTLYVSAPANFWGPVGRPVVIPVHATALLGRVIYLAASGLPPGATFADQGNGDGLLSWPSGSSSPTQYTIQFTARTDAGDSAYAQTALRIDANDFLALSFPLGKCFGSAGSGIYSRALGTITLGSPDARGADGTFHGSAQDWVLTLDSPFNRRLTPGIYSGAVPQYIRRSDQPGISLSGSGGYSNLPADFSIRRIEWGTDGSPQSLWATFEAACSPGSRVTGEFRLHADTSIYVLSPADLYALSGTSVSLRASAVCAGGTRPRLSASPIPPGATLVDHGDGSADFSWPAGPAAGESLVIVFQATDSIGRSATSTTWVHGGSPLAVDIQSSFDDPIGQGATYHFDGTDGAFDAFVTPDSGVTLTFSGSGHTFSAHITDGGGVGLREGASYLTNPGEDANPPYPECNVSLDGNACTTGFGHLLVRQLRLGQHHEVQALWVTFDLSCYYPSSLQVELRYLASSATAVLASFVSGGVSTEGARLRWYSASEEFGRATVERRTSESSWQRLGIVVRDGAGYLEYADATVVPGHRYGWRIAPEGRSDSLAVGEIWFDVPTNAGLEFLPIRPNPASKAFAVYFSLPRAAGPHLEVCDVAGRVQLAQDLGFLGAGVHSITLPGTASLSSGCYFVRLDVEGRRLVRRVVIVR
jgi:hypothetical protein